MAANAFKKKVFILTGPTGVGKSALSLRLAKQLDAEIISADSVQCFKQLAVGSAKLLNHEMESVKHHLIDFLDVTQKWDAGAFTHEARSLIDDIISKGKTPLVVGGSTFFLKTLIEGIQGPPSDWNIRNQILKDIKTKGWDDLFLKLQKLDPVYAATLNINDNTKLSRALELCEYGKTPTQLKEDMLFCKTKNKTPYDFRNVFLMVDDREEYYRWLDKRCEKIVYDGLLHETLDLIHNYDCRLELPSDSSSNCNINYEHSRKSPLCLAVSKSIGYQQAIKYLLYQSPDAFPGQFPFECLVDGVLDVKDQKKFRHFLDSYQGKMRQLSTIQIRWMQKNPIFLKMVYEPKGMNITSSQKDDVILASMMEFYNLSFEAKEKMLETHYQGFKACSGKQARVLGKYKTELVHFRQAHNIRDHLHTLNEYYHSLQPSS